MPALQSVGGVLLVAAPLAMAVVSAPERTAPPRAPRPVAAASATRAVERSLPLLQASADTWYERRTCSSCHHQGLGLLAVAVAREHGIAVDTARMRGQATRTMGTSPVWLERLVTGDPSINEAIGQSYRAIGGAAAGVEPSMVTDALVHMLIGKQHTSGRWSSYSRRPPLEDSEVTATALTVRALQLYARDADTMAAADAVGRARTWLAAHHAADHEDRVMQLFGMAWAGASSRELAPLADALFAAQRADGGWAQVPTRPSDAYATGSAVTVLSQAAGVPMRDARLQRAVRFLTAAQKPDGSWQVPTRRTRAEGLPYFETGYPHGVDQFISYAGAAWATIALTLAEHDTPSTALMGRPRAALTAPIDRTRLNDVTPLMWAAWRGTVDDVRRALAAGASARDTTRAGLTALMFAAGDLAKTRLLLDAGADPNVRTAAGYAPLVLAAARADGGAAARLLVERGAQPDVTGRTGSFTRTTALAIAVVRGDTALAQWLLDHGASVHGAAGTPETPMLAATWYGDADAMRWLVARGAAPTDGAAFAPADAPPLLSIAAEDGRTAIVRVLLAAGADVHATDAEGLTPLHAAVSSPDRGHTDIVSMLLQAGADPARTTRAGESVLAMARRWATPDVVALVERAAASGGATRR